MNELHVNVRVFFFVYTHLYKPCHFLSKYEWVSFVEYLVHRETDLAYIPDMRIWAG